jgi:hypothetical protein
MRSENYASNESHQIIVLQRLQMLHDISLEYLSVTRKYTLCLVPILSLNEYHLLIIN